jgi:hypothetical protein
VSEVLRRTKSQAFLFGQLRRAFPDHAEDELRALLVQLKHDPEVDIDFTTEPRRPTVGREAAADACWATRASQLASVIECSSPTELLDLAKQRLGWGRNFTIQTLAAAEDAGLLTYEAFCWARSDMATRAKIKTIRIKRTLPCVLTLEQSRQASSRAAEKLLERERLEAELKTVTADLRARIREANKAFYEAVISAHKGMVEQEVECDQKLDYKLGVVEVVRLDTGELIEARELRADEKQLELGATG